MSFEWPVALLGLPIAAVVIAWVVWRGDRTAERPWYRPVRPQGPLLLFGLGLLLLTGSLARPIAEISVPRIEGRVVIAVDNSSSMLALDEDPSRIGAAQAVARRIVEAQGPTTAIGLVTFSSGGVVLQAPTTDHRLVSDAIDRLGPDGGTSLAEGLFVSLETVIGEPIAVTDEAIDAGDITLVDIGRHDGDVIVVLSDGENRGGLDPLQVADLAAKADVRIFTVGLGGVDPSIVELDGFTVATSLDESRLTEIALATDARYFAGPDLVDVDQIDDAVRLGLRVEVEEAEVTGPVAAAGVLCTAIAASWSLGRTGRVL